MSNSGTRNSKTVGGSNNSREYPVRSSHVEWFRTDDNDNDNDIDNDDDDDGGSNNSKEYPVRSSHVDWFLTDDNDNDNDIDNDDDDDDGGGGGSGSYEYDVQYNFYQGNRMGSPYGYRAYMKGSPHGYQGHPFGVTVDMKWSSSRDPIPASPIYTSMYTEQQVPNQDPHVSVGESHGICYPSTSHPSKSVSSTQRTPSTMVTDDGRKDLKNTNRRFKDPIKLSTCHPSSLSDREQAFSSQHSFPPSIPVSGFQGLLTVAVWDCIFFKDNQRCVWEHPYITLMYGSKTYTIEGKSPFLQEKIEIELIEGVREMEIYVSKSNGNAPQNFIGTRKIELHKVHFSGHDCVVRLFTTPQRYSGEVGLRMIYSNTNVYNASGITDNPIKVEESRRMKGSLHPSNGDFMGRNNTDSPSKVEESRRMKGSLHPSNGDVRSRNNREVMEKLNDLKISEVKNTASFQSSEGFLGELENNTLKRFSHEELNNFTSGFSDKVGSGGFGNVYRGQLHGAQVAVKVLAENHLIKESFQAEVSAMYKTSHRNLVRCYGYCYDHKMKALVYEYTKNGSLDAILFGNPHKLEWRKFYKISIETAKGLSYLHEGSNHQIIHHDLKPANVLLDTNLSAKITDFGLARFMDKDVTHATLTRFRGTAGYVAPEICIPSSEITSKCDVYSFGMMLFEIVRMKRNAEDSKWFPKLVWLKFDSGELDEIIDDCGIQKKEDKASAKVLCMVALWCIQFTPQTRPPMSTVLKMLEGEIPIQKPPNPLLPSSLQPPPQRMY